MKLAEIKITKQDGSFESFVTSEDYAVGIGDIIRCSCNAVTDEWYFPESWWRKLWRKLRWY